jgi:hypothetical protein
MSRAGAPDWGVTPTTARLLTHWRSHGFSAVRPFFCQIEAVETVIWLTEVAWRRPQYRTIRAHLEEALGRSRGGFSTKVHLRTDAKGRPLVFELTGGEAHEVTGRDALMELFEAQPEKLLGDKGYDANAIRADLEARGIEPVILPKSNRTELIEYDREAYKA